MLLLIHRQAKFPVKVLKDEAEINFKGKTCTSVFWEMAEKYPQEIIAWCETDFIDEIDWEKWEDIFHHNLIMASYAIKNTFFQDVIGYIDQLPFVSVNRKVSFGTWQMSSDVGGIIGEVLLQFKALFGKTKDFSYLLNSVAKIGQQNGLFCYSNPKLVKNCGFQTDSEEKIGSGALVTTATKSLLFNFVYQFYKTSWVWVLLWCYFKYEKQFPIFAALKSLFGKKLFLAEVDLSGINVQSKKEPIPDFSVDVIIPTMGRPQHLFQVLEDLAGQSHLPEKVIVVEQDPEPNSKTALPELQSKTWPFELKHHFIHQTGACNARNIALEEVNSDWIFFADDDIRFEENLLKSAISEIKKFALDAMVMNCKQQGQQTIFKKTKQWGAFGSGTSLVKASTAKKCHFSPIFEHGYGEDMDFGMQLRNEGADIIYHPELKILHLKAPMGGFRKKIAMPWEKEKPLPKPSPTLMAYAYRYYTPQQVKGFKTSLFLKYYSRQEIKNPFTYIRQMKRRWDKSREWAKALLKGIKLKS